MSDDQDHLRNMLRKSAFDFGASPLLAFPFPPSPADSPSFSFTPAPGFTNFIGCSLAAAWPLAVLLVANTRGVNASWDLKNLVVLSNTQVKLMEILTCPCPLGLDPDWFRPDFLFVLLKLHQPGDFPPFSVGCSKPPGQRIHQNSSNTDAKIRSCSNLQLNSLQLGAISLEQSYCCFCLFLIFNKGNSFAVSIPDACVKTKYVSAWSKMQTCMLQASHQ